MEKGHTTPVLGMMWDRREDRLWTDWKNQEAFAIVTKRTILSVVNQIFDAIGFLCPVLLRPKKILQQAWLAKRTWDEALEEKVISEFKIWYEELAYLPTIRMSRNITGGNIHREGWQLHVFADASQEAYAAVVYLRTQGDNNVSVQLLQAKSRVTPIRRISIPRLELFGCVLAIRLTVSVKTSLELEGIPTIYWTDSTTALAWIRRNDQWGTLVGNRVREILSCTNVENWRHVPGNFNPADLPSRGCTAKRLKASSWWMGPDWLSDVPQSWPSVEEEPDEEIVASEKRRTAIASMINIPKEPMFGVRLGSFEKNVRAMAFILRIATWCKAQKKSKPRLCEELTTEELNKAKLKLMWLVQQESFETVGASFHGLEVLLGEDRLVRVKTKLVHRNDSVGLRFPILLPGDHPIVSYLILSIHHRFCHAGVQFVLSKLREQFWILRGRREIKRIIASCVICRRFKQKRAEATPGALPKDRVKDATVFETTGVDLCGPLYLKTREKVWIVLFTCAVYRCMHLELVTSLSAEAFLLALRRFIGRRGRPSTIRCDRGTNFVGAENLLDSLDWRKIEQETAIQRISWKFNPAAAPWWGGFWERLIRSVKDLLKRILGKTRLTYTELTTCVIDVEAVINQRPLTYVAEDGEDLVPLTPAMFLREIPEVAVPALDQLEKNGLRRRYRHLTRVRSMLKERFRKEYLAELVHHGKLPSSRPVRIGDVVLVGSDNRKHLEWPLARVLDLLPGKDGISRVARLKLSSGELIRPIQQLYLMEGTPTMMEEDDTVSTVSTNPEDDTVRTIPEDDTVSMNPEDDRENALNVVTRSGRRVRKPIRFTL